MVCGLAHMLSMDSPAEPVRGESGVILRAVLLPPAFAALGRTPVRPCPGAGHLNSGTQVAAFGVCPVRRLKGEEMGRRSGVLVWVALGSHRPCWPHRSRSVLIFALL